MFGKNGCLKLQTLIFHFQWLNSFLNNRTILEYDAQKQTSMTFLDYIELMSRILVYNEVTI